jgi:hypothetical protein
MPRPVEFGELDGRIVEVENAFRVNMRDTPETLIPCSVCTDNHPEVAGTGLCTAVAANPSGAGRFTSLGG